MASDDYYFDWLARIINSEEHFIGNYIRLLSTLYERSFTWSVGHDDNREADGLALRSRYLEERGDDSRIIFKDSCSILEMMVALAIRIEDSLMYDPDYGDRTPLWFWDMIKSLGLERFTDDKFDAAEVNHILSQFLSRDYSRDGKGGLFTVKSRSIDMRKTEIWYQMNFHYGEILGEI